MIISTTLLALMMMAEATASPPTAAVPIDPMEKAVCHRYIENDHWLNPKGFAVLGMSGLMLIKKGGK